MSIRLRARKVLLKVSGLVCDAHSPRWQPPEVMKADQSTGGVVFTLTDTLPQNLTLILKLYNCRAAKADLRAPEWESRVSVGSHGGVLVSTGTVSSTDRRSYETDPRFRLSRPPFVIITHEDRAINGLHLLNLVIRPWSLEGRVTELDMDAIHLASDVSCQARRPAATHTDPDPDVMPDVRIY